MFPSGRAQKFRDETIGTISEYFEMFVGTSRGKYAALYVRNILVEDKVHGEKFWLRNVRTSMAISFSKLLQKENKCACDQP